MYRKKEFNFKTGLLTATSAILLLQAPSVYAQVSNDDQNDPNTQNENASVGGLNEIVVTARKRAENLQDVPISVAVIGGDSLDSQGIQMLGEAIQSVPGVSVTPTPVGDLLFIRGIGSGENQGFEMSVGTFVDGVYFGRGQSSRHAFLDVERIEVLKGPQSILFGKNTIAGALNITTRKPTKTLEASIQEYIEPEFGTFRTTGVVSGPLSDTLAGRLVVRSNITDGYINNSFKNTDEPRRRDWVGRATFSWEPTDSFEALLKGEYGEAAMKGGRAQISKASPTLRQLIQPIDPNAEYELNYTKSGPGVVAPFDKEFENATTYNASLTATLDVDAHVLTSTSSYAGYDLEYAFDADFTPLDLIHQLWNQEWHVFAQELRLASTSDGVFEYQGGVYFASEKLQSNKLAFLNFSQTGLPFGSGTRVQSFEQKTNNLSVFAEGTFHATDALSVVAGYRYTHDKKKMDKSLYFSDLGSLTPNPNLTFLTNIGLGIPHQLSDIERSSNNHSLAFTVRYKPNDIMYYASYTQGFKAGGFDEGDSKGVLDAVIFDDEKVDSFEIGVKGETADRRLRGQIAIFHSIYDNLQVSIFDGVAALSVGNAASAKSSGIEVQGQLALSDRLSFGASGTYLKTTYDSYPAGPCPFGQGVTCDLSGKRLPYAPKFSGSLNMRWEDEFSGGWTYAIDSQVFHSSSFFTAGDLDAFVAQGAFTKVDASISINSPNEAWSLALIGKNLTDKTTAHFGDDIPLSNIFGNSYQQYVDPPRTIALQFKYHFR